ncbi:MAG: hypothetical protein OEV43_07585 [Coriobacteriia bacterium]|nr:hypothetical protein [Coriobacteriia bacterium]
MLLPRMIDALYRDAKTVTRLDVVVRADAMDLPDELLGIVSLLPPGRYTRQRLCDQLNSAITGHGWGGSLGTVQ